MSKGVRLSAKTSNFTSACVNDASAFVFEAPIITRAIAIVPIPPRQSIVQGGGQRPVVTSGKLHSTHSDDPDPDPIALAAAAAAWLDGTLARNGTLSTTGSTATPNATEPASASASLTRPGSGGVPLSASDGPITQTLTSKGPTPSSSTSESLTALFAFASPSSKPSGNSETSWSRAPETSSPATLLLSVFSTSSTTSSPEPATTITVGPTQTVTLTIPAHRECSSDSEYCATYPVSDGDMVTITVPDVNQATVTNPADWVTTTILPSQEEDHQIILPLPIWVPSLPCIFNCGADKPKPTGEPPGPIPSPDCTETFTNTLCTQLCTVIHQTIDSSSPARSTVCRQPSCGSSIACTPSPASTETVSTTAPCTVTFTNYFCNQQCTARPATAVPGTIQSPSGYYYSTTCAPTAACQSALQCSRAGTATVITSTTVTTLTPSPTLCSPDKCGDACLTRLSRRGDGDPGDGREILGDELSSPDDNDPQPWWDHMRHLVEAYGADPGPPGAGRSRAAFTPFGKIDPSTNQFIPSGQPGGGGVWPMQGCTAISVVSTRGVYTAYLWESPTMTSFSGQPAWEQNVIKFFRDGDSGFTHNGKTYNRSPSLMQLRDIGVFNLYTMALSDMWVHIFVRADARDPTKPISPDNVESLAKAVSYFSGYPKEKIQIVPYQSDPFDEPPGTSTPDNRGDRERNMLAWQFAPKDRVLDGLEISALRLWFNKEEVHTRQWFSRMSTMCTPFACGRNMDCAGREPDPAKAKAAYDMVFSDNDFEKPQDLRLGENEWWKHMDEIVQVNGANYGARNDEGEFLRINNAKAQFIGHDFGDKMQSAEEEWAGGIYQLNGCVGVVVVSDQAIYTAHLWEETLVAGSQMAAALDYNYDEQLFRTEVRDFLREGNDPVLDENYISPGLEDMVAAGGAFDPDTRSFIKIYVIGGDNEELSRLAGAPTWAWEDAMDRLKSELLDILKTSSTNVVQVHYSHRPQLELDMIAGTNRLAILYSPWHNMEEGKVGPAVNVYFDRRLVDEISWSNPINKLGGAFGAEEPQWSATGYIHDDASLEGDIDGMSKGKHVLSANWSVTVDPEVAGPGMYDVRVRLYIDDQHFVSSVDTNPALWQAETISMGGQAQVGDKNFFVRLETSFVLPEGGGDRTKATILARQLLDHKSTGPYCAARVHGSKDDPVTHKSKPASGYIILQT